MTARNRYSQIIERIFFAKYAAGAKRIDFDREEIVTFANELGLDLPKNLGDLVYSFRYRAALPPAIQATAAPGQTWIIRPAGRAKYAFELVRDQPIVPNQNLVVTKVPDATPGMVAKYALSDEQSVLARVRYNRLVDIFTGVACFSLQNHLRTTAPEIGQVEIDEVYVGVDKHGAQYIFPVQAKGGKDKLSVVQIEQDLAVCAHKFPSLVCRPIGTQFVERDVIAVFGFEQSKNGIRISEEKHYMLVAPDEVTEDDLRNYRQRLAR